MSLANKISRNSSVIVRVKGASQPPAFFTKGHLYIVDSSDIDVGYYTLYLPFDDINGGDHRSRMFARGLTNTGSLQPTVEDLEGYILLFDQTFNRRLSFLLNPDIDTLNYNTSLHGSPPTHYSVLCRLSDNNNVEFNTDPYNGFDGSVDDSVSAIVSLDLNFLLSFRQLDTKGGAVEISLDDLLDVNFPTELQDGDLLVYNDSTGDWENQTPATSDITFNNVTINNKLTVGGLIDPTGLTLTPQASNPETVDPNNCLWVNSGDSDALYKGANPVDGGENNTASNVGTGTGVFKQKTGVDLEFKSIADAGGSRITVASTADEVTVDVNQANLQLAALGDTNTAGVAAQDVLKYDGANWVDGRVDYTELTNTPASFPPAVHAFDGADHSGVDTSGKANGDVLKYDGANWVDGRVDYTELTNTPATFPPTVHAFDGADHSGVNTAGKVDGEVLQYDGADWVNKPNDTSLLSDLQNVDDALASESGIYQKNGNDEMKIIGNEFDPYRYGGSANNQQGNFTGALKYFTGNNVVSATVWNDRLGVNGIENQGAGTGLNVQPSNRSDGQYFNFRRDLGAGDPITRLDFGKDISGDWSFACVLRNVNTNSVNQIALQLHQNGGTPPATPDADDIFKILDYRIQATATVNPNAWVFERHSTADPNLPADISVGDTVTPGYTSNTDWDSHLLTYNSISKEFTHYRNGAVAFQSTTFVDLEAGTFPFSFRYCTIAGNNFSVADREPLQMEIHHVAVWDRTLSSSEATSVAVENNKRFGVPNVIESGPFQLSDLDNVDTAGVTDGQIIQYQASTNSWVPATISLPPLSDGRIAFSSATAVTQTFGVANTPQIVNAFAWALDASSTDMDAPVNGRLRYIGIPTKCFNVIVNATIAPTATDDYEIYLYKNGVIVEPSAGLRLDNGFLAPNVYGSVSGQWRVMLATNDYIEMWAKNFNSTAGLAFARAVIDAQETKVC